MVTHITDDQCRQSYEKHKNLKIAASEIGMKWQTLYSRLRKLGVRVTGDKTKYGSLADKVGAKGEKEFQSIVPFALDNNLKQFQAPVDFDVNGFGVDVKAAKRNKGSRKFNAERWSFSIKKQESTCDFFVLMAYDKDGCDLESIFLIPSEICKFRMTISISCNGSSKWKDYKISKDDLCEFFKNL